MLRYAIMIMSAAASLHAGEEALLETLRPAARQAIAQVAEIPVERKADLNAIATHISTRLSAGDEAQLIFICTHNSRRSHLAQIWAQSAAAWYGINGVRTYSGGTEATACNIRTVRAMRRAGFSVVDTTGGENPHYLVQFSEALPPSHAFSKKFADEANPQQSFAAIMTCSSADEACPFVPGAAERFSIPYVDPKQADGTTEEAATYDHRSAQIAREMFYLMARVKA